MNASPESEKQGTGSESRPDLILGTRGSALALAQTALVREALDAAWPGEVFKVREIRTTGDKRQDLSLTHLAPGGHGYVASATVDGSAAVTSPPMVGKVDPGLFTKELETELLAGTIHVAVHSLKDLPTVMPDGLKLAAVLPRANTEEVLIFKEPFARFDTLPPGATLATSSLRRQRQLQFRRPDLRVGEIRGNVGTRLRKLHEHPDWAGLVLARAGLERLGYTDALDAGYLETEDARFAVEILGPALMMPAVGQGAIGLQCCADDAKTLRILASVNHAQTWAAVTAERRLLILLGGGCQMPLGVNTVFYPERGRCGYRRCSSMLAAQRCPRSARRSGRRMTGRVSGKGRAAAPLNAVLLSAEARR